MPKSGFFSQNVHFKILPKKQNHNILTPETMLKEKIANSNQQISIKIRKSSIFGQFDQKGKYWAVFGQNGQNGEKNAWKIFLEP